MDPVLRHRVIGIVVLLGLAAVVLPLMLDGDNAGNLLMDTRMPPPPEVPDAQPMLARSPDTLPEAQAAISEAHALAEPEPVQPVVPDVAAPVADAPVVAAAPSVQAPDAHLAGIAEAWDVQLAALSSEQNASLLQAQLAKAGYKARVIKAGALFRVLAGPELRREDAVALRDKLAADARFARSKGMLVRYVP